MAVDSISATPGNLMYQLDHLSITIGDNTLLHSLSLDFPAAELCMVVGPNGAGKTTLLKALDGELKVAPGSVRFAGKDLSDWPNLEISRLRAVLPQYSNLNFPFSVLDVVLMGRTPHNTVDAINLQIAHEVLALCDCDHLSARAFPTLSGGEQQRVQTARVLAQIWSEQPGFDRFLLLDEPISALDLSHQHRLLNTLKRLARDQGIGIICTLHNLNLAAQFADRCVILDNGRLVADGPPAEVFTEETLSNVFDLDIWLQAHPQDPSIPLIVPRLE